MDGRRLLIANRGEISLRIARGAAELGIGTVAVYSEDDAASLHRSGCDTAVALVGSGAKAYLDVDQVIAVARTAGCDAVHPGYGFLSENASLARACREAGLVFVGPSPETLDLFGNKSAARALATRLGVPVLAGSEGEVTADEAAAFLDRLGSGGAIAIKAVSGGGGRGIRLVSNRDEVAESHARCRSEANAAFGSPAVYVEQALRHARHIEVQVAGDRTGEVIHLHERECSLQRRHQKIMEVAPSPSLTPSLRERITSAAVAMARDARYHGLGTFEFLVDAAAPPGEERFFFIEANPRIQVEHTVTEEVTSVDLVHLQLRLLYGETLVAMGLSQDRVPAPRGFAIQARVNMETMMADGSTRPSGGELAAYEPPSGHGIRTDGFGYAGYRTSPAFDSLLAKVIVHTSSPVFADAAVRLDRALAEFRIEGVPANIGFLRALARRPEVRAGAVTTGFIDAHMADLVAAAEALSPVHHVSPERILAGAKVDAVDPLAVLAHGKTATGQRPRAAAQSASPDGLLPVIAPLQGTIVSVANAGDTVRAGAQVAVMESMKMEHEVRAARGGVVARVEVQPGETVYEGHTLLFITPHDALEDGAAGEEEVDLSRVRPDLQALFDRRERTLDAARPAAVARRRATGQRTARENIEDLTNGQFTEYGQLAVAAQHKRRSMEELIDKSPADGMITGIGTVNGDLFDEPASRCAILSYDYTVFAGTQGNRNHVKTDRLLHIAAKGAMPVIIFTEGGGGRPGDDGEGTGATNTFVSFPALSGLVPLVGINSGRAFAGNAALLGMCDVIIATRNSNIGMGGPAMVEGGGLGVFTPDEIGPMDVQVPNGVVDIAVEDEAAAVAVAKKYLSYFQGPLKTWEASDQRLLRSIVPENRVRAYEVRKAIDILADVGTVLELRPQFGLGMVTALIRIEGQPVGVIANNPMHLGGAIDSDGSDKAARFLQLCDAFDLPVLTLIDTPGIMVGPEIEHTALVRHCSRLFVIGANIQVPMLSIVLRKWVGLGGLAMAGGSSRVPYFSVAWPTGEFAGMGLEGSVKLGYREDLAAVADPEERRQLFDTMVAKAYENSKALRHASLFAIDDVIDPAESRAWVAGMLRSIRPERRSPHVKRRPGIDAW